ncbi:hypothetical protein L1987_32596 [Smallanthus sonchifolius]|uniref:Uncharacterized protein n=1 Tax=Smallanthus sonchifolius TaxID=185202 RepID=A0ACB9HNP7_9ASTR|nr:hypothetical protein L1987_32596 [Smallanthus sonchifolius]
MNHSLGSMAAVDDANQVKKSMVIEEDEVEPMVKDEVVITMLPSVVKDFMGGKPTGRFSKGKTLADYMVDKLGVKDYLPAYLDPFLQDEDMVTGVSFASATSGFDPLTAKLLNVFSLWDQIEMFKEYIVKLKWNVGEEEANDIIENSLYMVSWSSNDWVMLHCYPSTNN